MPSRTDRYPALAASALLHAAIILSALIAWPWAKTLRAGDVVPVTLVSSADLQAPAPAVQAPKPAPAATPEPTPEAPPQPVAQEEHQTPPAPAHKATPTPKTVPAPTPKATPTPAAKAAQTPTKAHPQEEPNENWEALAQSLARQERPSGARQSSASKGAPRPNQALQARSTQGVAATLASGPASPQAAAALGALQGELAHLWNPNCGVPVGDLLIKVSFRIGSNGQLVGEPGSSAAGGAGLPAQVAAERAVRAVNMANPFADPQFAALYGQNVTVTFAQKHHCSS
ncbi:MAG TPA: hypothetical protein VKT30_11690 [Caulobacteraceae bacterium]|nr:hypothetical protein [Caulobacteraceae bacterium]